MKQGTATPFTASTGKAHCKPTRPLIGSVIHVGDGPFEMQRQPPVVARVLRWPEPSEMEIDLRPLEAAICALDRKINRPYDSFGLELKVQYALETASVEVMTRKPFYRLAQEPIILSYWDRISAFEFTATSSAQFSTLLNGSASPARSNVMAARGKAGERTIFEAHDQANNWIGDIHRIKAISYPPLLESIIVFSRVVFAHPFKDGNGRLARALFYTGLARSGFVRSPCLALGPGFDFHRERLARATIQLSQSGNWPVYINEVSSVVAFCVQEVASLL